MSFEHPDGWWWALLALPWLWMLLCSRDASGLFFPHLDWMDRSEASRAWLRPLPALLESLAIAILLLSLCGPRWSHHEEKDVHEGMAIQLVVDVSSSMDISTVGARVYHSDVGGQNRFGKVCQRWR